MKENEFVGLVVNLITKDGYQIYGEIKFLDDSKIIISSTESVTMIFKENISMLRFDVSKEESQFVKTTSARKSVKQDNELSQEQESFIYSDSIQSSLPRTLLTGKHIDMIDRMLGEGNDIELSFGTYFGNEGKNGSDK